jgi:hypothetical protein
MTSWSIRSACWLVLCSALSGCRTGPLDAPDAAPSPQAQAEPAPLATTPATAGPNMADAGPTPQPLRGDTELAADVPHEAPRETNAKEPARDAKELGGYSLLASLRTGEGPSGPKGAEVNLTAIEAARRKLEAHVLVEASQTRARFVLSGGFVLPQGAELRARSDRYGHLLLWPGEDTYRIVEPGALRALIGERRLDIAPLSQAEIAPQGEGARRLNMRTRRVDVTTRAAKATLELGTLRDAGEGGVLVCRLLLDLMSAHPAAAVCATDEVPLHAELRWTTQGSLVFDVTSMNRRLDLAIADLAAPPSSAAFAPGPPPLPAGEALLTKAELAAFRTGPVDTPPGVSKDAQAPNPEAGLLLVDSTDELRVAWLDGVPVAWVAPGGRQALPSLLRGRYVLQWRTFLGDAWDPPETIVVPGTHEVGGAVANRERTP